MKYANIEKIIICWVCILYFSDVTDPVITGCPEAPIVLYPMDKFPALNLAASDNFGVKSFKSNSDLRAGDTVLSSQTIIYTATDFQGLTTPCNVVIRVIGLSLQNVL